MIFKVSNYYLEKKKINYFGCEIWMFTYIFYKELFVLRRLIEYWSSSPLNATNNSKLSFVKHLFSYFFYVNFKHICNKQMFIFHYRFFFFNFKNTLYHTYLFVYWKNYIILYVIVYPVESLKFLVYSSFCGLSTFEWFIRVCDFCR